MSAQYRVASRSMKDAELSSFLLQRDSITFRIDVTSRAEDRSRIACARDSNGADPIPPFGFREIRRATISFRRGMRRKRRRRRLRDVIVAFCRGDNDIASVNSAANACARESRRPATRAGCVVINYSLINI